MARSAKKKATDSAWRVNNRERWLRSMRDYHLRSLYGITTTEWEAAFEKQGRICAICGAETSGGVQGWHTDHCHRTKTFRAILCHGCNTGLGKFKDDLGTLRKAVLYLEKYAPLSVPDI
jgi:hypothetical protein